ncbi:MAG TPA: phosphopantetheine-binding protein [Bradyrhizobium sp.]|nr:phosphopantetheine-binding protein [Bradyrhizobium sp.]
MPATQTTAENELAELIIAAVNLEGVRAADIDPEAPLFGAGLGLDSIDALEIALEVSRRHGLQLRSDDADNRRIFATLRSLSAYIEAHRQPASSPRQ